MLVFFGVVLALSFVLLAMVFRSLLVPLKAVVMNVMSIAAAYGVVVAVFQWAWGSQLLGLVSRPDQPLRADDALRRRVRVVHGLRGLPASGPGGVRPHGRSTSVADGLAATARSSRLPPPS